MKLFVSGGCGYKGTVLIPKLLAKGYDVVVFDTLWFGNHLKPHPRLTVIEGDVRNLDDVVLDGVDAVIHLASVANDPCGDLDPVITWEVGAFGIKLLADKAVQAGVKRFIFASSGSVYGVREEEQVTEDIQPRPISVYNKTKMVAERVLLSYREKMGVQIVRPGSVCGVSPRMRLDLAVNTLTIRALTQGRIIVDGGSQIRPNIHIDDVTDVYLHLLDHPEIQGIYNAAFENLSVMDIAKLVCREIDVPIEVSEARDPRSYRINSDRLRATGFAPKKSVRIAITDIIDHYRSGRLKDEVGSYNLEVMRQKMVR